MTIKFRITMDDGSIEEEIQRELEKITDVGEGSDDPPSIDDIPSSQDGEITDESAEDPLIPSMADYVNKIQTQSHLLELELMECDGLIHQSDILSTRSNYDNDLVTMAQEQGMDVDSFKNKILRELEEEEERETSLLLTDPGGNAEGVADPSELLTNVAEDVVTGLLSQAQQSARGESTGDIDGFFVTTNAEVKQPDSNKAQFSNNNDPNNDLAVNNNTLGSGNNNALVVTAGQGNYEENDKQRSNENNQGQLFSEMGVVAEIYDSDKLERELLKQVLEMEQRRKQLDNERNLEISELKIQEDAREKELEEKRKIKQIAIQKEEAELNVQKQQKDEAFQKEALEFKQQIAASLEEYEKEINELARKTAKEKEEFQRQMREEHDRKDKKQREAAVKIQALYRGYCVRKVHGQETREAIEKYRQDRMEQRVAEIQILMDEKEELKRKKEEEEAILQAEEEAKKKREEAERQRQIEEEKRKKEEEKQRKEEEKRLKQEEEKRKKEEEKRRKEEEKRRKEEEKRKKEEEEKRRKEEEKRRKEEDKRKKEEDKRRKKEEEEERKRQAEEKERLEKIRKEMEEKEKKEQEEEVRRKKECEEKEKERFKNSNSAETIINESVSKTTDYESLNNRNNLTKSTEEVVMSLPNGNMDVIGQNINPEVRGMTDLFIDTVSMVNNVEPENNKSGLKSSPRKKTPRPPSGQKTPRPPSAKKVEGAVYERPLSSKSRNGSFDKELAITVTTNTKTDATTSIPVKITPEDDTRKSIKQQHELAKSHDWGEYLPQSIEQKRLAWIKECKPLSKILSDQKTKKPGVSKKPPRRPTSAKHLPDLDEGLILAAANVQALKQVTTVELHDLPGCTLKSLAQCGHLKSLCMDNCNLVTTEGLEHCRLLQYLKLNNNKLEVLNLKDLVNLVYLDVSHNALGSLHGLDGCSELRYLDVSKNKITRIGGLDPLKKLHSLNLSSNQLITSRGVSEAPTIQSLNLSNNHLPTVDDIDRLALLQELDVTGNSLMQVPKLTNQVLLQDLVLTDNSISFLSGLTQTWLPLLASLTLNQNSISLLDPMLNLLLLENLDLRHNQILDLENILPGLCATRHLLYLGMEGNPVCEDKQYSDKIQGALPFLQKLDSRVTSPRLADLRRTEFEQLCLTQKLQVEKLRRGYTQALSKCNSFHDTVDIHLKFFSTSHQLASDIRYTHEYGVSMVTPKEIDMNFDVSPSAEKVSSKPKELIVPTPPSKSRFESAVKGGDGKQEPTQRNEALDMKNKFEQTLQNRNHAIQHPASPTPKAMFEQNVMKTISQANNSTSKSSSNVLSNNTNFHSPTNHLSNNASSMNTAADMKSKFDLALIGINSGKDKVSGSGNSANNSNNLKADSNGVGNSVKSSKSFTTNINASTVKRLLQASQSGDLRDGAATKIQACWRGYHLRKQLEIAYNYARCDDLDDDLENFAEVDLGEFDFNMDDLDRDLEIPDTPQIPKSHPVLGKPPSHPNHKPPTVPHLFDKKPQPPDNPKQAWRNADSALSDLSFSGRPPLPPLSRASDGQSCDTHRSKKSERLADEWGFKDTKTAELMMARAKKLKYNADKRKKLSQLDPKQRLALFRKLEETTRRPPPVLNSRKQLPRKEYFQAREQEMRRQEFDKHIESQHKSERTFEWVHTQVGNHDIASSRMQKSYGSEGNLPRMDPGVVAGGRTHLINSPVSMDLQSVESASTYAEPVIKPRKFSQNSAGERLPPIRSNSNSAPSIKAEKMSFRNPKTDTDPGWGGGRKRNKVK